MAPDRAGRTGKKLHEEKRQRVVRRAFAAERHDRTIGIARQRLQTIQPPKHFDHRVAHVGADRKAQRDLRLAGIRVAFQLFDAGDALQHAFDRLEDFGFDFLR
jgi:hypothetical protein